MRQCGILLPVASLHSKYGIGTFGKAAYEWIDFLSAAGQHYWQVLPLTQTGYGDSPYQSVSTYAGNPYFIDPEMLQQEGLLTRSDLRRLKAGENPNYIDYAAVYQERYQMLKNAVHWADRKAPDFLQFVKEKFWLEDYALYMAIKDEQQSLPWTKWPEALVRRDPEAMDEAKERLHDDIVFYEYIQFLFDQQWKKLKEYANDRGIQIIGDIPIYCAMDSADVWGRPELFQLDETLTPLQVAGCPPDGFAPDGQLWGNPLYDWTAHKKTGYVWWIERIREALIRYDTVRVDHFRGFEAYYCVPYGDKTAANGHWEKGPGYDLFKAVKKVFDEPHLIAEDLGFLTEDVHKLLDQCGYPGMKVLIFGFDSGPSNPYLPHQFTKNSICYTGTHDNETLLGWHDSMDEGSREFAYRYLRINSRDEWNDALIAACLGSVSDTAIIPIQDYLKLDNHARINTPSTLGMNWQWRLQEEDLTEELSEQIREVCTLYGRG